MGKKPNHVRRMRARLIGTDGKTRRVLEDLSETYISVYGNTVGVIGDEWGSDVARRGLDMLLSGAEHRTVYSFMERMRRKRRLSVLDGIR